MKQWKTVVGHECSQTLTSYSRCAFHNPLCLFIACIIFGILYIANNAFKHPASAKKATRAQQRQINPFSYAKLAWCYFGPSCATCNI